MSHFPELSPELVRLLDVPAPRYTSYPTVPSWTSRFGAADYARALAADQEAAGPLSLYVHIPFCREMCSYCGCNVIISKGPGRADRYLRALWLETRLVAQQLGARRGLMRLHLGGGTPTFLDERQLAELWRIITDDFTLLPGAEVALEIDPVVTRRTQLELLARLGFNRLSMGVQDFDPAVQQAVNRVQSVQETRAALEAARELGFGSVSFDLIYGLPRQTPASWRRTLEEVIALRPDRVSLFSMAYVPQLKPHQRRLPLAELPVGPSKLALFRLAYDMLLDAGYLAIGMDHFALPKDDLATAQAAGTLWRDFQGYTVLRAADTVALGVTGISSIGGAYAQMVKTLPRYEAALLAGELPVERGLRLTADDLRRRAAITQLMCNGVLEAAGFPEELRALAAHERLGLVTLRGTRVELTPVGRVFVRNVAMVFDAYLQAQQAAERPMFSRAV